MMIECSLTDCKNYLIKLLQRLSSAYDKQNDKIEDFARWNLPNDIAEDWDNNIIEYFLKRLLDNGLITDVIAGKFNDIVDRFDQVSMGAVLYDETIWTHEGLRAHSFWTEQRELAMVLLRDLLK